MDKQIGEKYIHVDGVRHTVHVYEPAAATGTESHEWAWHTRRPGPILHVGHGNGYARYLSVKYVLK